MCRVIRVPATEPARVALSPAQRWARTDTPNGLRPTTGELEAALMSATPETAARASSGIWSHQLNRVLTSAQRSPALARGTRALPIKPLAAAWTLATSGPRTSRKLQLLGAEWKRTVATRDSTRWATVASPSFQPISTSTRICVLNLCPTSFRQAPVDVSRPTTADTTTDASKPISSKCELFSDLLYSIDASIKLRCKRTNGVVRSLNVEQTFFRMDAKLAQSITGCPSARRWLPSRAR